ncbi:MAG: hypothetical protein RLZZ21_1676 [Planctomycetota bacterium]|jgi:hypothetical protein
MADILFAFDPALDRPVPVPEAAPADVTAAVARAAADAFDAVVTAARSAGSSALVLCGRVLDPRRASPAQAAELRKQITTLASHGCATVFMTDDPADCAELVRMLGEPAGLRFVTPHAPLVLDVGGLDVELALASSRTAAADLTTTSGAPLHRRIVVGWDDAFWQRDRWDGDGRTAASVDPATFAAAAAASPTWSHPGTLLVWASRGRQSLPPGMRMLHAVQARGQHEAAAGSCHGLTLLDRSAPPTDPESAALRVAPHADWRSSWREIPTHRVTWRTLGIDSPAGGDEELATAIWSGLESLTPAAHAPVEIVSCSIACGTSVARRVRVAEIAAETLARVRQLYDPKTFRVWCRDLVADPGESLAPLGHTRSGSRPGTTTSFSSALADIVAGLEQSPAPPIPADLAREAGWLALELVEST